MTGAGWDFAMPLALALLPLPLAAFALRRPRGATPGALRVPAAVVARLGAGAPALPVTAGSGLNAALAALAWVALVIALAGPRTAAAAPPTAATGRDIVFALDLSGSMVAKDFLLDGAVASRIDVLRRVGSELIRRRTGDRVGLVIFAEKAYAAAALTFDVASVGRTLVDTPLGLVGHSTAIGDGLGLALKRLSESTAPTRIIVLLSDGANDAGTTDPIGVAFLAKELGVRIYTIGLGLNDTQNPNGDRDPVDFLSLQRLAEISGGEAFRVRTTEQLAYAGATIERLIAGEVAAPAAVVHRELWPYPASLAFAACMGLALARTRPA